MTKMMNLWRTIMNVVYPVKNFKSHLKILYDKNNYNIKIKYTNNILDFYVLIIGKNIFPK